ncbi:MAG: DUF1499 domain-containing protein, partial [Alphaproteobacteria bacterium]|nr:DUF1499 domain-containing protein [Alphaproteobacteria bacterium]
PNRFLVCPDDYCRASADLPSPIYKTPAAALRDRWLGMISRQPRVERTRISADGMQFDFVQRSWLLRFPDTITVRFIDLDDGRSTLAVYSRSHYGHSDLGVNRQRIKAWLAAL